MGIPKVSQHEFSGFPNEATAASFTLNFSTATRSSELWRLAADGPA
jgi:hypothetical protein